MSWRFRLRATFAVVIVFAVLAVGYGYASHSADATVGGLADRNATPDSDVPAQSNSRGITVVATDSNSWLGNRSEGPRALAELVAFEPNGSVLYYDDSHTRYWDVDPVPGTRTTVEYGFADHRPASACPDDWNVSQYGVDRQTWEEYYDAKHEAEACTLNGFERANLSTGEVTRIWSRVTPGKSETRYHDVDRVDEAHLLVADIYLDRVFVVNAESGRRGWTWNVSDAYATDETGGPYPEDWSHVNDVELLPDGRIMASLRNHDRVVFLNRSGGLMEDWTLGEEDDYDVLYEQHNPDYVPAERGGPAVVVADSENNRVVEYRRTVAGRWEQSWTWRDARMQWPRDADRLPNGHTLITDSNGNRVFEVDENGEIVWSVDVAFPYEAERLGTGDESAGGQSARERGLASRTPPAEERFWIALKGLLPGTYLNGLMYVTPPWMGFPQLVASLVGGVAGLGWAVVELHWVVAPRFLASEQGREVDDGHVEDD